MYGCGILWGIISAGFWHRLTALCTKAVIRSFGRRPIGDCSLAAMDTEINNRIKGCWPRRLACFSGVLYFGAYCHCFLSSVLSSHFFSFFFSFFSFSSLFVCVCVLGYDVHIFCACMCVCVYFVVVVVVVVSVTAKRSGFPSPCVANRCYRNPSFSF